MSHDVTHKRQQHGQSMVEYLVVSAALATALFWPIDDDLTPDGSRRSAIGMLVDGMQEGYQRITRSISLPE